MKAKSTRSRNRLVHMMQKSIYGMKLGVSLGVICVSVLLGGCTKEADATQGEAKQETMLLATTTSTENSGLLGAILPDFTKKKGIEVKVIAVGTGKALEMGRQGEVDALLVHAKKSEEEFIKEGHGISRFDVMYNDFILIGPEEDPCGIKEKAGEDILLALKELSEKHGNFISRGDDSGTHKKEKNLWNEIDVQPRGKWYISAGKGMGDTIQMANEMLGYTLTDRATYLSMKNKLDLVILSEKDAKLFNQYGVLAVNPDKNDSINEKAANAFIEWILSEETGQLIEAFGKEEFGQSLFTPNGKNIQ